MFKLFNFIKKVLFIMGTKLIFNALWMVFASIFLLCSLLSLSTFFHCKYWCWYYELILTLKPFSRWNKDMLIITKTHLHIFDSSSDFMSFQNIFFLLFKHFLLPSFFFSFIFNITFWWWLICFRGITY